MGTVLPGIGIREVPSMCPVRALFRNESGAAALEYAVLCAIVAISVIVGLQGFGEGIAAMGARILATLGS